MHTSAFVRFASVLALAAASTASAQIIFDSAGFEAPAYSVGPLPGQNGWTADTPPGTAVILDLGGGNQAVAVGGGETNWFFPSINYTPAANTLVVVQADISRTLGSSTSSFGYAIDLYNENISRLGRFGLVDNGGSIQVFVTTKVSAGVPDPSGTATSLAFGSAIPADQFVHFEASLNYATQTFRVKADSVDLGYDFPFIATSTQLADADIQVSSSSGADDQGHFDNYVVYAVAIPEPSSYAALAGLAVLGLGLIRRRR